MFRWWRGKEVRGGGLWGGDKWVFKDGEVGGGAFKKLLDKISLITHTTVLF